MRSGASDLKWWLSLAVIACITLTGGLASAQNAQGLAAVGAIDPANGYPRWYLDKNGLQLGQCLDAANPADPCAIVGTFPNPGQPISFPNNFPDEFFYWRTTTTINNIGNVGGRDRKSTRLNSSHQIISYAVFCLKKKKKKNDTKKKQHQQNNILYCSSRE